MIRLALLFALLLVAPAQAKVEVAESGTTRAELEYKTHKNKPPTGLVERVYSSGELIVEREIPDDAYLQPGGGVGNTSVRAVDLDGDGTAEAIFDFYSGGAHCCLSTDIFQGTTRIEGFFGNIGYRLRNIRGHVLFMTADDRFSYRYGSYAGSMQPLQALELVDGELTDVTRDPVLVTRVKREARKFRRRYRKFVPKAAKEPVLREVLRAASAANAADQCTLGDCAKGYAFLDAAVERGELKAGFAARVRRDMVELGYD